MLQTIRDRLTGWVAAFVIAVIGIALVVSFGNMNTDVATGGFAARVNGEEIPVSQYRQLYQNQLLRQQEAFQGELPPEFEVQLQRNVLEGLVRNRVLSQYTLSSGYRVDDEQLAASIRSLPAFQVGGEFSSQSYIAVLASEGLTPEAFERDQRTTLTIQQLQAGLVETAFLTPADFRRYLELDLEQREVSYVTFEPVAMLDQVSVTPEDVQAYYDANPAQFETEESVALEYIELLRSDVAKDVSIDEDGLREFYAANQERFRTEEERRSRHILIAVNDERDEAEAAALAAELRLRLDQDAEFAELAREYSDDPGSAGNGGELGWAGRGLFVGPFEDTLFDMEPGQISQPVRTEFGFHIIELEEVSAGQSRTFEEVRDELRAELQEREAEDRFFGLAEQLDDLALENPGSLGPAAEALGLPVQRADQITRSGGAPFGFNQGLVDAAFSPAVLEDGENSPLLELDDGRAVVVRVVDHRLPAVRPFEEVRDQVAERMRLEAASAMARERGESVLARLEAGEALAAVAAEAGGELKGPEVMTRRSDTVAPDLLAAIFRTPSPADGVPSVRGLATNTGGYAVIAVSRVQPGQPADVPRAERDQRKTILAQQSGNAALSAMILDLRADAKVEQGPDVFADPEDLL